MVVFKEGDTAPGETAAKLLEATGVRDGIAVVADCGTGRLCWELAARSRLRVIGIDTNRSAITAGRQALLSSGAYRVGE